MLNRPTSEYQAILDQCFSQRIAGWESLSAWDPMKVFAESLSVSLGAIEQRQTRLLSSILDSLPSLLAFDARPATAPGVFVSLTAAPKLKTAARLEAGTLLRFHSDAGPVHLRTEAEVSLEPIQAFACVKQDRKIVLTFANPAQSSTVRLYYFAGVGQSPRACVRSSARVVANHTADFTQTGAIEFEVEYSSGECKIELDFDVLPSGTWHANAVIASVFRRLPECAVAPLLGEPWEVVALPQAMLRPPTQLLVRYPDEQTATLQLAKDDLLALRHQEPEVFGRTYFYNGTRHALVIPGAAQCMRGFLGGVSLHAHDSEWSVDPGSFFQNASFANELPKLLQSATLVGVAREATERESAQAYLDRFYRLVKEIPARPRPGFFPADMCASVPAIDSRVLSAETSVGRDGICVFYLLLNAASGEEREAIVEKVESALRRTLPLGTPVRVQEFFTTPLVCTVQNGQSLLLVRRLLENRLQPAPMGTSVVGHPLAVAELGVRIERGENRECVSELSRRAGERFALSLQASGGAHA